MVIHCISKQILSIGEKNLILMYMYQGRKKILELTILRVRNVGFVRTRRAPRRGKSSENW